MPTAVARNDATDDVVLAAEARRIETIERISRPTIAIFDAHGQGGGSGVIISADGYALTNFHVAAPIGPALKCGLPDGRMVDAVVVGFDPGGDVALIKLIPPGESEQAGATSPSGDRKIVFPAAALGDSDSVRVGDWAYVVGNPFLLADDFQPTVTYGIISGVHRYQYPAGTLLEYADCIQTDAAINPGNSGGPLFDADGKLIGINGRGSFEKRGRVNVGVGYAISINQIQRFLGLLKSGRVVDHASLGATVAGGADGRVMIDEILEDSDAFRRGLRFDDEIVRFGTRDIRTVNAFKNALGTYPAGWKVPITYRRDGQAYQARVRLANYHRAGELEALLDSQQGLPDPDLPPRRGGQPPGEPGEEQPPDGPPRRRGGRPSRRGRAQDELPAAVKPYYEQRSGYANYWFNRYHQQRVWNAYLAHGDFADAGWNWKIRGQLAADGEVEIVLSENHAAIVMPQGRSEAEFGPSLSGEVGPPRSGGLLAALHLWQRLLVVGPRRFGEIHYVGTLPWKSDADLDDCLAATYGGVVAHLFFDPQTGHIVGLEMSLADDQDPCEIYFSDVREVQGRMLPHRWLIRHGDEEYADLQITAVEWKAAEATGSPSDK